MTRISAFLTHLSISLVIFVVLGYLILEHWYPDFFFATDGGWQGIRIVALVDLVLGPTLTLLVFKPGKPGLKTDLTLIGLFQGACLAAGTWVVFSERPLAMVYSDGFFHSVTADDYREAGQWVPRLDFLPGDPPKWVTVRLPEDYGRQSEIRRKILAQRAGLYTQAAYYEPFKAEHIDIDKDPFDVQQIQAERPTELARFLERYGGKADDYLFLPFGARHSYGMVVFRRADRRHVGVLILPVLDEPSSAGESPGS